MNSWGGPQESLTFSIASIKMWHWTWVQFGLFCLARNSKRMWLYVFQLGHVIWSPSPPTPVFPRWGSTRWHLSLSQSEMSRSKWSAESPMLDLRRCPRPQAASLSVAVWICGPHPQPLWVSLHKNSIMERILQFFKLMHEDSLSFPLSISPLICIVVSREM